MVQGFYNFFQPGIRGPKRSGTRPSVDFLVECNPEFVNLRFNKEFAIQRIDKFTFKNEPGIHGSEPVLGQTKLVLWISGSTFPIGAYSFCTIFVVVFYI